MGKTWGSRAVASAHSRKFIKQVSVEVPSTSKNSLMKVATIVQQIITELSEAVSETDKIMAITGNCT
jgi:hypothetical protein